MNERTRQGLHALEAALLLGVLGDALLRATPWGLNFFLWTSALLAAVVALLERWRRAGLKGEGGWLLLPIILPSAAFAWRDSPTLRWLDALIVLCMFGLLAWRASGARLKRASLTAYARGLTIAGVQTLFGSVPLLFADVRWRELPRKGWSRHAFAIVRGLLIAVPLLVVFGGLFMAADAVFARLINRTFYFDVDALVSHGLLCALFAWLTAGYLRGLLFGELRSNKTKIVETILQRIRRLFGELRSDKTPTSQTQIERSTTNAATQATTDNAPPQLRFSLGVVEIGVVLGLLDALFLGFVCVQIRYLFGGAAWVINTGGLTYAEYARRGFFELVWATALVLPLLLTLHWLLRKDDKHAAQLFRALALAQIALLFVVIASAITRMRLYQSEYGLTELRLYTTAFMGWLALVFVWFIATVLRDARERFMCGALVSALFIVGALHLLNPDALIIRANLAHARKGHAFDAAYATTLSADAVPPLVAALPALSVDERCAAARELLARWAQNADTDWRSWSMARSNAQQAVATNEATLRAWACAPPVATTTTNDDAQRTTTVAPAQAPPSASAITHEAIGAQPASNNVAKPMLGQAPPTKPHDAQQVDAKHDAQKRSVRW